MADNREFVNFFDAGDFGTTPTGNITTPLNVAEAQAPTPTQKVQIQKHQGSDNTWLIVVVVAIVVLLGTGALIYYYNNNSASVKPVGQVPAKAVARQFGEAPPAAVNKELIRVESLSQWNSAVVNAPHDRVVAYTMTGCGHCTNMMPSLEKAGASSKVPIYNLNFNGEDWKSKVIKDLNINGFPTIVKYKANQAIAAGAGIEYGSADRSENALRKFSENA